MPKRKSSRKSTSPYARTVVQPPTGAPELHPSASSAIVPQTSTLVTPTASPSVLNSTAVINPPLPVYQPLVTPGAMAQVQPAPSVVAPPEGLSNEQFQALLQAVQNPQAQGNVQVNPIPIPSVNSALGLNVSHQIKQKIVLGEYIDFGQLLGNNSNRQGPEFLTLVGGHIHVQSKGASTKITSIEQWTDAFLIYASIYAYVHPEAFQGLLKYLSNIRLGASRTNSMGWKLYDEQFRCKKAMDHSLDWGVIDQELWLIYMQGGQSVGDTQTPTRQYLKCFNFNNGFCPMSTCRLLQSCLNCSGNHPVNRCFQRTQTRAPGPRPRMQLPVASTPRYSYARMQRPLGPRSHYH